MWETEGADPHILNFSDVPPSAEPVGQEMEWRRENIGTFRKLNPGFTALVNHSTN
jgi:hypothetical protein